MRDAGRIQVVNGGTAILANAHERSVLCSEVKAGRPIVGQVFLNGAGGTCRRLGLGIVHVWAEGVSAHDCMHMGRDLVRADNGISPFVDKWYLARKTPESRDRVCRKSKDEASNQT